MNDLISRQAAIQAIKEHRALYCDNTPDTFSRLSYAEKSRVDELNMAIATLVNLPPAQQWIPVKYRPMTEEEREYWSEQLGYDCEYDFGDNGIFDCQMPDDGQKILVCSQCGNIWVDTHEDDGGLMGLMENGDWDDIVAWMPLPEPYRGDK